jgi:hypothetical protein
MLTVGIIYVEVIPHVVGRPQVIRRTYVVWDYVSHFWLLGIISVSFILTQDVLMFV